MTLGLAGFVLVPALRASIFCQLFSFVVRSSLCLSTMEMWVKDQQNVNAIEKHVLQLVQNLPNMTLVTIPRLSGGDMGTILAAERPKAQKSIDMEVPTRSQIGRSFLFGLG